MDKHQRDKSYLKKQLWAKYNSSQKVFMILSSHLWVIKCHLFSYTTYRCRVFLKKQTSIDKKSDQQNTWQGNTHLGVCDEDRWWAGSVQDFTAADFPDATPDVWVVPAQDLRVEGGKYGRRADFYFFFSTNFVIIYEEIWFCTSEFWWGVSPQMH